MYIAIQIQHPNFTMIFDFSPYLEEKIYEGLQDVKSGVFGTHFYWYSLLMHMFLYRNADYFEGSMKIRRTIDNNEVPMHLWSMDMSRDRQEANFVRFDNNFASKLRQRFSLNPQRIPT